MSTLNTLISELIGALDELEGSLGLELVKKNRQLDTMEDYRDRLEAARDSVEETRDILRDL